MMSFSDLTLMAYVDGELDQATCRAIEAAMRQDAAVARRVARYRATRGAGAAAPAAHQPRSLRGGRGPDRGTVPGTRGATVVQLDAVRASRAALQLAQKKARRHGWGWLEWSVLALVLVAGLAAGRFGLAHWQPGWLTPARDAPPTHVASRDGALLAQGKLAQALSQQMGGAVPPADAEVRVGLSFLSREGGYCRSFTLAGSSQDLSGIACRSTDEWRIPVLVQATRPLPQMGGYRYGGSEMPTALIEAIDQRIVGGMLDPRAELEALRRGWQR